MRRKALASLGLLIALAIGCYSQSQDPGYVDIPQANYASPDDAITAFFAGLSRQDYSKVMSALDIVDAARNFDFSKYSERLQAVMWRSLMPTDSRMARDINVSLRLGEVSRSLEMLLYTMLIKDDSLDFASPVLLSGDKGNPRFLDDFLAAVDTNRLNGLKLLAIADPASADLLNNPRTIASWKALASIYGADQYQEKIALFRLNGRTMCVGFGLYRYGASWKISGFSSSLAGTEMNAAKDMSEAEFYAAGH